MKAERELRTPSEPDDEDAAFLGEPSRDKPPNRTRLLVVLSLAAIALLGFVNLRMSRAPRSDVLKLVTWNIAAINNNPFEYWITHEDAAYNKLMADVQSFIDAPGARDVAVSTVFTPAMWAELKALMVAQGWPGIDDVAARWEAEYAPRKIVSGFMKDKTLGDKRLASMPDRITNTINTRRGVRNRPTVINCFAGDMTTTAKWWANWKDFMFKEKLELGSADAPVRPPPARRSPTTTAAALTRARPPRSRY